MIHSAGRQISVGMLSLGCPKTLVDSELVLGQLNRQQYKFAESVADCDIAFLNTCAFIEDSKQESIDRILELVELKKTGHVRAIVVLGCLFQRYPDVLSREFKEVDAFVGTGDYAKIPAVIERIRQKFLKSENGISKTKPFIPFTEIGRPGFMYTAQQNRIALTPNHFRYVKVSEGCDHQCSFCTIPSFRGKHRSRPIDDIVREVKTLASVGAKEIVLTGQDTTHFGKDYSGEFLLPKLLQELNQIEGIEWIRILYAYPIFVGQKLINAIAALPKVCHYLDMPLQHISDDILKSMRRGVGKDRTVQLVQKIRKAVPDMALRTTFIVGYPGETDKHFEELLDFMQESMFERLGIFMYSQEEDTPAALLEAQIPKTVKQERFDRAMQLQQEISHANNQKWLGKRLQVMIDEPSNDEKNVFIGRTFMDAPEVDGLVFVRVSANQQLQPGQFVPVLVTGSQAYDLTADLVA
ncbi:MAG: 30S ribosomal protein S12 methylthiotransferase RimO [Candidatus Omnitrophica bacterium CG11_big_fil_rev_8_21_14_0_20_45_26]|uniref:Ribosomal protein uS12 methylthiotransferase RimO n=1 Tax=Candidatus Abzuiibacterium crystallinum TaxID=1974748 RepID=A0A2H0LSA3_9BACT|nr:MAG: 30S ribosomal protein S12 methylthiotransferase RimO [Candidatus Omnitrophica bacterium CG11_big_fil_rev_8_21_14_0_20_45_26]PIW64980.1 MAG: 30S ribosomal protein S12 methylthiotransferase RimO [Candidatus Omnitrophica bacterium CG12_big_fil_rev_8_21_14_0_65_45_16]